MKLLLLVGMLLSTLAFADVEVSLSKSVIAPLECTNVSVSFTNIGTGDIVFHVRAWIVNGTDIINENTDWISIGEKSTTTGSFCNAYTPGKIDICGSVRGGNRNVYEVERCTELTVACPQGTVYDDESWNCVPERKSLCAPVFVILSLFMLGFLIIGK